MNLNQNRHEFSRKLYSKNSQFKRVGEAPVASFFAAEVDIQQNWQQFYVSTKPQSYDTNQQCVSVCVRVLSD